MVKPQKYEHQLWQLADLYDVIQLHGASETLMDYASHVAGLQLEVSTRAGIQHIVVPSKDVPNATLLYKNLSAILSAANNTGSLVIDYADPTGKYKDGFLPVILDIQSGAIKTTCTNDNGFITVKDSDHQKTGGIHRALNRSFATEDSMKQPPLFPAIFDHMTKIISAYKAASKPA